MKFVHLPLIYSVLTALASESNALNHRDSCQTPLNDPGTCLRLKECSHFTSQIKEKPNESFITQLVQYICGNMNEKPLICCPSKENPSLALNMSITEPLQESNEDSCRIPSGQNGICKSFKNCPLLNEMLENAPKIVDKLQITTTYLCKKSGLPPYCCPLLPDQNICGSAIKNGFPEDEGNSTELFQFPWMALIGHDTSRGKSYDCFGSIINTRYILTTASCLESHKPVIHVRLGEYNPNTERDCVGDICAPPTIDIPVEKYIEHPSYNRITLEGDIALIRLQRDIEFSNGVRPICLFLSSMPSMENYDGKRFVTTSWADLRNGDVLYTLMKSIVRGITYEKCSKELKRQIQPSLICAKAENGNECTKVSGSPLVSYETVNGKSVAVQHGIASYRTPGRCEDEHPIGYTNINFYKEWILEILKP